MFTAVYLFLEEGEQLLLQKNTLQEKRDMK